MLENKIPVIKTSLAALSIMITHYREILFLSILPIIFMLPALIFLPDVLSEIINSLPSQQETNIQTLQSIHIPSEIFLYSLLFLYGYSSLNINLYRLTILGFNSTFKLKLIPLKMLGSFLLLSMFIALLNAAPYILKVPLLEPIIFVFVAHLMLNLVIIASGSKFVKLRLPLIHRLNIAILQFIIPSLILALFSLLGAIAMIIAKIILIYWTAINLGLVFNNLFVKSA